MVRAGLPMSLSSETVGAPTDDLKANANSGSTQGDLTRLRSLRHNQMTNPQGNKGRPMMSTKKKLPAHRPRLREYIRRSRSCRMPRSTSSRPLSLFSRND